MSLALYLVHLVSQSSCLWLRTIVFSQPGGVFHKVLTSLPRLFCYMVWYWLQHNTNSWMHAVFMHIHYQRFAISLQARKISPVFSLQPSTIYIVKEFDNVAVFPHESSGRFNSSLIDPSAIYEVHGEEVQQSTNESTVSKVSSFGAYTGPTAAQLPPRSQLSSRRSAPFGKPWLWFL